MTRFLRPLSRPISLLVLVGLILVFFYKMAFTNLILGRGDTLLYFYPYWSAAAHALRNGQIPFWNPHLFMGAPMIANSQVGFFYPLNWPLWLAFSAPYAVSASILLHLVIAAMGTFAVGRRALRLSRPAALIAALLFALGGYLTAQVEHVNQLQGLAWLPWALFIGHPTRAQRRPGWRTIGRKSGGLSLVFALQLTAGHTQTVFITGVGLLLWVVAAAVRRERGELWVDRSLAPGRVIRPLLPVVAGAIGAMFLAAVQLLPTLELVQHSSRQGGLPVNEALSFSLHPLLLGRALLPTYDQALFSEYVAFLPVTALLLALVGAWGWRRRAPALPAIVLVAGGLFLALGRFNPFTYLLLQVPGFNFFRAPARWLVLYGLGAALLAGVGWDTLSDVREGRRPPQRSLRMGIALILLLVVWSLIAVPLADFVPTGEESPVVAPSVVTVAGWLAEGVVAYFLLAGLRLGFLDRWRVVLVAGMMGMALFLASRTLPYNHLTTPATYFELRPPVARLQALASCDLLPEECRAASPGRMISLSDIFFDLGDQEELEAIYADQLPPDAFYDYVVATKHKEVLSPNMPLTYGLASVDGFDGGILPLRAYSALVSLVLPDGVESTDGRLREYLTSVPDSRWLDLFNARYLITDKVGDIWRDGVFFDTQHAVTLSPGDVVPVGHIPPYEATEVWLLGEGERGSVRVSGGASDGRDSRLLSLERMGDGLWRAVFSEPFAPDRLYLQAPGEGSWSIHGLALVDGRDDTFQSLVPGQYRLILSGDVKMYENLDVLPRAFVVPAWTWQPDVASSVEAMASPDFRPWREAVVVGEGASIAHEARPVRVEIVKYRPEEVVVHAHLEGDGLLILTDAYYPGWRATLNGERRPIYQVDGLFRGLMVPAGDHEIVLSYESRPFLIGRAISLVALLMIVLLLVVERRRRTLIARARGQPG